MDNRSVWNVNMENSSVWNVSISTNMSSNVSAGSARPPPKGAFDDCENESMVERFITNTVVEMPIASLGILGNIVSFIVLCRQKQKLTTTILLQCLAIMDTLILISTILLRSLRYMHICVGGLDPYYSNYHHIFRWLYPVVYFFRQAQTWLITLLTIDRWIAVCRPLHAQRLCTLSNAYKQMTFVLLLAFIVTIPRFFEVKLDDTNNFGFTLTTFSKNKTYTIVYKIVLFFIMMYLIPMVTLIVLNTQLILTLRRATIYRAQMQSRTGAMARGGVANMRGATSTTSHRSITIIVCVVVIVCIISNLFAMASHLLWSLAETFDHLDMLEKNRRHTARGSNILITISSAINFFIYCLCSRNFRSVLLRTFLCSRHCAIRSLRNRNKRNNTLTSNMSHTSLTYMPVNGRAGAKQCIVSIEKNTATSCRL